MEAGVVIRTRSVEAVAVIVTDDGFCAVNVRFETLPAGKLRRGRDVHEQGLLQRELELRMRQAADPAGGEGGQHRQVAPAATLKYVASG